MEGGMSSQTALDSGFCADWSRAAFREDRPDLVLLDLNLPNSSGLELPKQLVLEDKETAILVFSMHAEPIYAVHTLKAEAEAT
jgi:two-component system, NarL family, invasion response regulator UvrY